MASDGVLTQLYQPATCLRAPAYTAAPGGCRRPSSSVRLFGSGLSQQDDGGLDLRLRCRTGRLALLVDASRRTPVSGRPGCTLDQVRLGPFRRREPGRADGVEARCGPWWTSPCTWTLSGGTGPGAPGQGRAGRAGSAEELPTWKPCRGVLAQESSPGEVEQMEVPAWYLSRSGRTVHSTRPSRAAGHRWCGIRRTPSMRRTALEHVAQGIRLPISKANSEIATRSVDVRTVCRQDVDVVRSIRVRSHSRIGGSSASILDSDQRTPSTARAPNQPLLHDPVRLLDQPTLVEVCSVHGDAGPRVTKRRIGLRWDRSEQRASFPTQHVVHAAHHHAGNRNTGASATWGWVWKSW